MPLVEMTRHLFTFFPSLEGRELAVTGGTVAEVVQAVEQLAPGVVFYVCDEVGRMRQHVNVFMDGRPIRDRGTLTDPVGPDPRVLVL